MIRAEKLKLRQEILNRLRNQKEEDRATKSELIKGRLFADPEFQCSTTVLFYASFAGEVETFTMMKQSQTLGKKIALPVIMLKTQTLIPYLANNLEEDLESGPYGIRQPRVSQASPLRLEDIDLAVVPGVAFDRRHHRLGRGGGYYDRLLASLPQETPSIGLAFDFQIVTDLPSQEHDIPVTRVITNA